MGNMCLIPQQEPQEEYWTRARREQSEILERVRPASFRLDLTRFIPGKVYGSQDVAMVEGELRGARPGRLRGGRQDGPGLEQVRHLARHVASKGVGSLKKTANTS